MQVRGARRGAGPGRTELGPWEYVTAILVLLGVAALMVLSGCGSGKLVGADGIAAARPLPVEFGKVAVGARGVVEMVVHNRGNAPLTINGVEPLGNLPGVFQLPENAAGTTVPAGGKVRLPFGFVPSSEKGYTGDVLLRTDSSHTPSITVPLSGEGARPVVQCSSRLDFGRVVLNQPRYLGITCLNPTELEAEVRVNGVQGRDASLFTVGTNLTDFTVPLGAGESARIEVEYTAGYLGQAEAEALLEVPGAADPTLHVPLTGEAYASDFYAEPPTVDFGAVNVNATASVQLDLVNDGTQDVIVGDLDLTDPDGVFTTDPGGKGVDITVPAGSRVAVEVHFSPRQQSSYVGSLTITSSDLTNPRLQVRLQGRGGGAQILVTPDRIDFGSVATQMLVTRRVFVSNVGTAGDPLTVTAATIQGDPATFRVEGLPAPVTLMPGDDPVVLTVTYQPLSDGNFVSDLVIASTDGGTPQVVVPIAGSSRELAPCVWVAEPTAVQFGNVAVNTRATLSTRLRNVGTEDCVFSSVALTPGSDRAFTLQGGGVAVATVPPGAALTLPVNFQAAAEGDHRGSIEFYVSDPAAPQGNVPVLAHAGTGCLSVSPGAVDFGVQRLSCPVASRQIQITNGCSADARLTSVDFGPGNASAGEITRSPFPQMTLRPGASTTVTVHYDPVDEGLDSLPLLVQSDVLADPITVPVSGQGSQHATRTDHFRQEGDDPVDVLWVVDNSGSMMEEQKSIADGFTSFIQFALAQEIDYHIGVTTTGMTRSGGGWQACPGGVDGGESGRLFPADGARERWITPRTADAQTIFEQNVKVGICHWWEEGLEAAHSALASPLVDSADDPRPDDPGQYIATADDGNLGFYRADARLVVIIVSDEDDHGTRPASYYTQFFRNLKGAGNADRVTVHGVLGDGCSTASGNGDRYNEVIDDTGGVSLSICTSDWEALLETLAEKSFGFTRRFPLSGVPEGDVTVSVDGVPVASGWTYDASTGDVVFEESATPAPGAAVDVTYTPACGT